VVGFFLGKFTTKSGRARIMEFSQNQTCRRLCRSPEMSGWVWSGSVRVRLVEFGLETADVATDKSFANRNNRAWIFYLFLCTDEGCSAQNVSSSASESVLSLRGNLCSRG